MKTTEKKHDYLVVRKKINGDEIERLPAPDIYTAKACYDEICKKYNTSPAMGVESTGIIELHINGRLSMRCWYTPWAADNRIFTNLQIPQ